MLTPAMNSRSKPRARRRSICRCWVVDADVRKLSGWQSHLIGLVKCVPPSSNMDSGQAIRCRTALFAERTFSRPLEIDDGFTCAVLGSPAQECFSSAFPESKPVSDARQALAALVVPAFHVMS